MAGRYLGPECFAVRVLLFDKTRDANWKATWHQDVTIAVTEYRDVEGWGPWSRKDGVWHVRPPAGSPSRRRVLHAEFAAAGLPDGFEWAERIGAAE